MDVQQYFYYTYTYVGWSLHITSYIFTRILRTYSTKNSPHLFAKFTRSERLGHPVYTRIPYTKPTKLNSSTLFFGSLILSVRRREMVFTHLPRVLHFSENLNSLILFLAEIGFSCSVSLLIYK